MRHTTRCRAGFAASISRWPILALPIVLLFNGGCATPSGFFTDLGEHVAYQVGAQTANDRILSPELIDLDTGRRLYANLSVGPVSAVKRQSVSNRFTDYSPFGELPTQRRRQAVSFEVDPGDEFLSMPRRLHGVFSLAQAGHRVPERVRIRWRGPSRPDQEFFSGPVFESPVLFLRDLIPADVLAQVQDQWRRRLEISVLIGDQKPAIRWRIVHRHVRGATIERQMDQ